jgi:hypothetical protein
MLLAYLAQGMYLYTDLLLIFISVSFDNVEVYIFKCLFRFRCLLTTLQQRPKKVEAIVLACCLLHNLLRTRYRTTDRDVDREDAITHEVIPGTWRLDDAHLRDVESFPGRNSPTQAKAIRDYLVSWVNEAGAVEWQNDRI